MLTCACLMRIIIDRVYGPNSTVATAINFTQGATENDRMIQYKILIYYNEELGIHPIVSNRNTVASSRHK